MPECSHSEFKRLSQLVFKKNLIVLLTSVMMIYSCCVIVMILKYKKKVKLKVGFFLHSKNSRVNIYKNLEWKNSRGVCVKFTRNSVSTHATLVAEAFTISYTKYQKRDLLGSFGVLLVFFHTTYCLSWAQCVQSLTPRATLSLFTPTSHLLLPMSLALNRMSDFLWNVANAVWSQSIIS
jgi:hypothetical protein